MSANLEVLLARLDRVKPAGKGYRAVCPSCQGKQGKLSVLLSDDGRILLHCFANCSAAEVVQAAGLTIGDLFPERLAADSPEDRQRRRRLARESQWGAALDVLEFEARIVQIAAADIVGGQEIDWNDFMRVCTALERIEGARFVLRDQPMWRPATVKAGT